MQVQPCPNAPSEYDLTWDDVRHSEGIYQQSMNPDGRVLVLANGYGDPPGFAQVWVCGSTFTGYSGPVTEKTRFRRVAARVCISCIPA